MKTQVTKTISVDDKEIERLILKGLGLGPTNITPAVNLKYRNEHEHIKLAGAEVIVIVSQEDSKI